MGLFVECGGSRTLREKVRRARDIYTSLPSRSSGSRARCVQKRVCSGHPFSQFANSLAHHCGPGQSAQSIWTIAAGSIYIRANYASRVGNARLTPYHGTQKLSQRTGKAVSWPGGPHADGERGNTAVAALQFHSFEASQMSRRPMKEAEV